MNIEDLPSGLLEKVMSLVQVNAQTGCWEYTGAKQGKLGYGSVYIGRQPNRAPHMAAHRLMWILRNGRVPGRWEFVCHKCDNPPCCNPDHMFLGSLTDNNKDMAAKGRYNHQKVTHCTRGHDYSVHGRRRGKLGKRACLICDRGRMRVKAGWPEDLAYSLPAQELGHNPFMPDYRSKRRRRYRWDKPTGSDAQPCEPQPAADELNTPK